MKEHVSPRMLKSAPQAAIAPKPKALAPIVHHATTSGGGALDAQTQRQMGARFGHDFSQVRIHTDTRAAASAQSFGANAYAVGSDIVFGPGRYAPGTHEGDHLIAHELTHVVQQFRFGLGGEARASRRGDASEQEAEALAAQVLEGQAVQVRCVPTSGLQYYRPPQAGDKEYDDNHDNDEKMAHFRTAQAIPGLGNIISGSAAMAGLGAAGYYSATSQGQKSNQALRNAEDLGLDAIPLFGNLRAIGQAKQDYRAVRSDEAGVEPRFNPNSQDQWNSSGQSKFNKSVSSIGSAVGSAWDSFF